MSQSTEFDQTETNYDCVVQFRKGKYYLIIEELGIRVINEDLASGYEELMQKKNQLIRESEESEEFSPLPPPRKFFANKDIALGQELKLFSMKVLITGTLILALIFLGGKKIEALASSVLDRSSHLIAATLVGAIDRTGHSISASIDKTLELPFLKAITRGVTPKEKEKIIKDIRKIVKRNKPFVDELKLLLINDSPTASQ